MNDLNIYSSEPLIPNLQLNRRSQRQNETEPATGLIEKIRQIIFVWFIYSINIFKLGYIVWFSIACYFLSFIYQREKSIYNQIVLITGSGGFLGMYIITFWRNSVLPTQFKFIFFYLYSKNILKWQIYIQRFHSFFSHLGTRTIRQLTDSWCFMIFSNFLTSIL